ncbi:hypothetical protein POM88_040644 [Heracleum sosnowskyi]|uniref:Helitron helicase-like domain-containing protein n=1 Tax=Heracleum sosnowskyi TaxID=360622 RepID=A0AAD8HF66_9APIA|nr:hypothetical protein POM88_040644 [Heracleum sosnowskyi]
MYRAGISKSTLYNTDRMLLRDHPICSKNVTDDNGERNGDTHSSGVEKSTLFIKERVPLRYHPMFPKNLTDGNDAMNGVISHSCNRSCNRSRQVLGDISNLLETCNVRRSSESNQKSIGPTPDINEPPSVPRKSLKRKCNAELEDLSRCFCSDGSSFIVTEDDTDYSQIENSRIVGFDNCEEGLLSDDELDDETGTNSVRVDNLQTNYAEDVPFDDVNDMKKIPGYVSLGPPSVKCEFCQAYMWKEERVNKNNKHGKPVFSLCCRKGQINLPKAPPTPSYLWQLYNDPKKGPLFRRCSRMYNSMFSFTSTGGNIDHSVNNGGGPYVYRLNGQNHHVFGSLIPNDGETPKFCQLYIYDTENEVSNRMKWMDIDDHDKINSEIVEGLMKMLDDTNELVKKFRVARDRFKDSPYVDLKIVLKVCRSQSGRENNIGPSNEVAAIMVGGVEDPSASRDIILDRTIGDNPDIVARVFRLKLDQLLDDIKKNSYFGVCVGVMYVVEFQKRGLPHVHMLIWLDSASKKNLMANVDKFVVAEIPDPVLDPIGYAAVKAFMIHGPCGVEYPKSPCMKDFKCTRHFPKKYYPRTMFDESGFPLYKRRNTGVTVKVRKAKLDNQWVVSYNRGLLVKYQCHINVEICCHARSLKYLFKYCLKGHDRATVEVRGLRKKQTPVNDECVNEIQAFFDGRYICGSEASYRTFGFQIHHRSISVERLSFHLPGQKNCTFRSNDSLKKVAEREKNKLSKLEAFFKLNITDPNARQFTYDQIPRKYVWNDGANKWSLRKKGLQIGRLIYTHHSSGEIWYLRLLLSKVRGCTSFESLRTVNGVLYSSYHEACKELGLLENDDEWHEVLTECSKCGFPPQIRQLFVHIIVNCQVTDVCQLWLSHCKVMGDAILIMKRRSSGNNYLKLSEEEIQLYALGEIDRLLKALGKSLKDYPQIPQPPPQYLNNDAESEVLSIFAKWVLDVGDGKIQHAESVNSLSTEFDIRVPHAFCNLEESNSVENMIRSP